MMELQAEIKLEEDHRAILLRQSINRHEAANKRLHRTLSKLRHELKGYKLRDKNFKENQELQEMVNRQAGRIRQLEKESDGSGLQISPLIDTLMRKLDLTQPSHVHAVEELRSKLKRMLEKKSLAERQQAIPERKLFLHGYVMQTEEGYRFYDLEQKVYHIVPSETELHPIYRPVRFASMMKR